MPKSAAAANAQPWVSWSVLSVTAIALLAFLVGFLWLPSTGDEAPLSLWASICRAAGVAETFGNDQLPVPTAKRTTVVVLDRRMSRPAPGDAARNGATFTQNKCEMCHAAQSAHEAGAPVLTGQRPEVIIKQLDDYQRGGRTNLVMHAMASNMTERQVVEVASFYAGVRKAVPVGVAALAHDVPSLVNIGAPMRNIAPCASCHGGIDRKLGAPRLDGMSKSYLTAQLKAFASGARANDSHAQMRNMARRLSAAEIIELAGFYEKQQPEGRFADRRTDW